ncbi:MAG: O-methyltransferase [Bacteroidales bacterium]
MIHRALSYINHRFRVKNVKYADGADIPSWLADALLSEAQPYGVDIAMEYLEALLQMHDRVDVVDLGAGSRKMGKKRRISDIARYSVSNYNKLRFLSRIAFFKNPESVLELGTSLGVSSAMFANVVPRAKVVSVEGCPNLHNFAKQHSNKYVNDNLQLINAEFNDFFLQNTSKYDLVFIDGNHRYDATLRLFDKAATCLNNGGVIVLDDIDWSWGMQKAWNQIKKQSGYVFVDVYYAGIITKGKYMPIKVTFYL